MIPFAKSTISEATIKKAVRVLRSGKVSNGKYCRELEEKVKEISGAEYAVAVNSCTTGLWLAQKELGFFKKKNGLWEKRIAVPAFTWKSTYWNLRRPVWMDCDLETWNVNRIPKADWAMVTRVFGNDFANILIESKNPAICDSAHALGTPFGDLFVAEVYSLAPSKTFTGCEGGVIATNSKALAYSLSEEVKWAGRLEEVNALVALETLKDWKKKLEEKRKIAHYYIEENGISPMFYQQCGFYDNGGICNSTHNEVGFSVPDADLRAEIIDALNRNDVEYRQRYCPDAAVVLNCPNAWKVYLGNINIPSWIGVDYKKVAKIIKEAYEEFQRPKTMINTTITTMLPSKFNLPDSTTSASWSK